MELLLYHLISYIKTSMPALQTVDEDYGQLEAIDSDDKDTYPLAFPALLVSVPDTEWTSLEGKSQKGTAHITVRLLLDCYDDTHAGSGTLEAISDRETMVDTLHGFLQGYRPVEDGEMTREKSRFYTWNHGIKVYEMDYTLAVTSLIRETVTIQKPAVKISAQELKKQVS